MSNRDRTSVNTRGFTLIEVMVVVVIVAILASLGYPSYVQYVTRSNRQAGRAMVMTIADRQEQYFLDNKSYADKLTTLGYAADTIGIGRDGQLVAADQIYDLDISAATATSYTIRAVPKGVQATRDTACATLTLLSTGERNASGGGEDCW